MEIETIFNKPGVIYKITNDISIETPFYFPEGCTLDFQGGRISGSTIHLNGTKLLPMGMVLSDYISSEIKGTFAVGQMVYDTDISKPKWWNGRTWVDFNGQDIVNDEQSVS